MKSAVQPNKKAHPRNNFSFNTQLASGYQSERVAHKAQHNQTTSFIKDNSMLVGINQTLRNFNTITQELEKINEQIGTFGPLENLKQRKGVSNSSRIT